MLLSVIVPVYNAGEYLKPCLQSLLDLPIEKEIIVVDDGSDDDCVVKLKEKREELKVISQANQGVSAARNAGLALARGEWIWFCDADDLVLPMESSEEMMSAIQHSEGVDMLLLPYIWEAEDRKTECQPSDSDVPYNLWRCWFRRVVIEQYDLRFTAGRRYAEDQEFILMYLMRSSNRKKALSAPIYHYTMRASGTMMKSGTRRKQRQDVGNVLWKVIIESIKYGQFIKPWALREIKRLIKNYTII